MRQTFFFKEKEKPMGYHVLKSTSAEEKQYIKLLFFFFQFKNVLRSWHKENI